MKNIIICADGTWNRPEEYGKESYPTNVLKFSRGVTNNHEQVVFYDWGIGSYHDNLTGGAFGSGLEKNVMDCYRFLVHNYEVGDSIYLFGFSRGAYTVRSLCGLINNCGILKSSEGKRVEEAFHLYKTKKYWPNHSRSIAWRENYSAESKTMVDFVGVWDTVGSIGIPFTFFGMIKDKDPFYDNKLGGNVRVARHALSLDESRGDFEPTLWQERPGVDLKQVWFAGVHCDVGGSYKPDADGSVLADIPMTWLMQEAKACGLSFDEHLQNATVNPLSSSHNEHKGKYKWRPKHVREIPHTTKIPTHVHRSVYERYQNSSYRSKPVDQYIKNNNGEWPPITD